MNRTTLITGAARGLGLFLTDELRARGFDVFAGYREPTPGLEALVRREPGIHPVRLDVTDAEQVRAAATEVAANAQGLDILVNNAAILPQRGRGTLEAMNIEVGLEVFDVNALGPLRVTQAFLPLLKRSQTRLIVNVSSEAGSIGGCWRKDEFLYCMSKAALNMQSAILHNDLSRSGFRVLAVHPGWLRTDMGGPNADLDPADAACALARLITGEMPPDAPIYVDHAGQRLDW